MERDASQAKEESAYRLSKAEHFATRKLIFYQSLIMSSEEQARKDNPKEANRIDRLARTECDEIIKGFPGTVAAREAQELRNGKRLPVPLMPADPDEAKAIPTYRMPDGERCVDLAAVEEWGLSLEQIPAIVVDKWLLKDVPYMSFLAGDYELNVYGDPDSPACIQLRFGKSLRDNLGAKEQGLAFLASLLQNPGDRCLIKSLKTSKDLQARGGLTFEVIPETEPGAHGCWCALIYSREVLEKSRASPQELRALTVAKEDTAPATKDPLPLSGSQSYSPSRGGSVIVKGYTKSNGKYVAPHTRAAPGSGGSRSGGGKR